MTTLAADAARDFYEGNFQNFPVIAADIIYKGAAVGDNGSGYARPLVAGDAFRGFANYKADNSTGANGDKQVFCRTRGKVKLAIASLAITDVGKDVYASDDNTFTLVLGGNTRIGRVVAWVSTGYGIVEFQTTCGVMFEFADSTTGTAADELVDAGATYTQANINNNFASVSLKINTIIRRLGN